MILTYMQVEELVRKLSETSSSFKIGVTSLETPADQIHQSENAEFDSIYVIGSTNDQNVARHWEKLLINEFHPNPRCKNELGAIGTGSLDASSNYWIYVVYN